MTVLADVESVEAFARWAVERSIARNGNATAAEVAEAELEAVALIFESYAGVPRCGVCHEPPGSCEHGWAAVVFAGGWDAERCPRFSLFLCHRLPRRLISWWRRQLRQSGRGSWSGTRGGYIYYGTVSLDAVEPESEDRELVVYG